MSCRSSLIRMHFFSVFVEKRTQFDRVEEKFSKNIYAEVTGNFQNNLYSEENDEKFCDPIVRFVVREDLSKCCQRRSIMSFGLERLEDLAFEI